MTDLMNGLQTVYTTGQVAKVCKVAPRTVSNWFERGRLQGYRIPGSLDRRIPRHHLLRFLMDHQMGIGALEEIGDAYRVLYVGNDRFFAEELCHHGKFTVTDLPDTRDVEQAVLQALPMCIAIDWSLPDAEKVVHLINTSGPYKGLAVVVGIVPPEADHLENGMDALDLQYEIPKRGMNYANFAETIEAKIAEKYFR